MSKHRRPHGTYARGTADWFDSRRMAGSDSVVAAPAVYSQVGLYNNATDGSILHVMAMTAGSSVAGTIINVVVIYGQTGGVLAGGAQRIDTSMVTLAGQITAGHLPALLAPTPIWFLGTQQGQGSWPYEYAIVKLAPGYTLWGQTNVVNSDCSVAFQWLVMGHDEGFT